jgi:hypothetical protein
LCHGLPDLLPAKFSVPHLLIPRALVCRNVHLLLLWGMGDTIIIRPDFLTSPLSSQASKILKVSCNLYVYILSNSVPSPRPPATDQDMYQYLSEGNKRYWQGFKSWSFSVQTVIFTGWIEIST